MGTFIKAFLISASIAGLVNMAAMAASPVVPGIQDEAQCEGAVDKRVKPNMNVTAASASAKASKVDKATGGSGVKKTTKKK